MERSGQSRRKRENLNALLKIEGRVAGQRGRGTESQTRRRAEHHGEEKSSFYSSDYEHARSPDTVSTGERRKWDKSHWIHARRQRISVVANRRDMRRLILTGTPIAPRRSLLPPEPRSSYHPIHERRSLTISIPSTCVGHSAHCRIPGVQGHPNARRTLTHPAMET